MDAAPGTLRGTFEGTASAALRRLSTNGLPRRRGETEATCTGKGGHGLRVKSQHVANRASSPARGRRVAAQRLVQIDDDLTGRPGNGVPDRRAQGRHNPSDDDRVCRPAVARRLFRVHVQLHDAVEAGEGRARGIRVDVPIEGRRDESHRGTSAQDAHSVE